MESKSGDRSRDSILEQAALWFARSRADDFSETDGKRLDAWLCADPSHRAAYREMEETWHETAILGDVSTSSQPVPRARNLLRGRRLAGLAIAALLMISVFSFKSELLDFHKSIVGKEIACQTRAGEIRKITLEDGSELEINGRSSVTINFNRWKREMTLSEGEVFLRVARDSHRPFEISSHQGIIRVLGTAFHVRSRNGLVSVDVKKGRVQVLTTPDRDSGFEARGLVLKEGEGTDYYWVGSIGRRRTAKLDEKAAWRRGEIVFRSMPLQEVLQELEYHHNTKLSLPDKRLSESCFTGTFNSHDLDEILQAIQITFSLKSETAPDGTITLTPMN